MAQYLLKATDAEFDRWRAAADAAGVSLASFLRAAADRAAGQAGAIAEALAAPPPESGGLCTPFGAPPPKPRKPAEPTRLGQGGKRTYAPDFKDKGKDKKK